MRFEAACSRSLAVLLIAIASAAEEPRDSGALDLTALMARMASTSGVIADFRERKQLALLESPLESDGTLYFVPPDRFARFTSHPEPSALIVDGETVRFRRADQSEFDLSANPMARLFTDNFIALFSGDLPRLEKRYRTRFSASAESWTLSLEPRELPLRGLVSEISMRGDHTGIREMSMRSRDGDSTTTALDVIDADHRFTDDQLRALFVDAVAPAIRKDR